MKNDKFSCFIRKLREEKNLSQQELADLIPIGREAISKWERGKTIPDYDSMIKLSEIFNLSINEILLGERKNNINNEDIDNISLALYKDNQIKKKKIRILSLLLIIVILLLLVYYFLVNYNSIQVYDLYYQDENISIIKGQVFKTNDTIYFNLGKIDLIYDTDKIIESKLYYKDKNNKDKFIMSIGGNTGFSFKDSLGYEEFFDFENIDFILNNLYIDIIYENRALVETIKINANKIYTNNNFFPQKSKKLVRTIIYFL